jgi:hypothetical protein
MFPVLHAKHGNVVSYAFTVKSWLCAWYLVGYCKHCIFWRGLYSGIQHRVAVESWHMFWGKVLYPPSGLGLCEAENWVWKKLVDYPPWGLGNMRSRRLGVKEIGWLSTFRVGQYAKQETGCERNWLTTSRQHGIVSQKRNCSWPSMREPQILHSLFS